MIAQQRWGEICVDVDALPTTATGFPAAMSLSVQGAQSRGSSFELSPSHAAYAT